MNADEQRMLQAIELARRGQGFVEPNPMVGCVIVRDGTCLGEGWHRRFGGLHAEVEALGSCRGDTVGATLYVTLEPCCHWGQTPPCTEAIVRAGIARVVVGHRDPFPAVAGQGVAQLRQAGLHVEVGVLERTARELTAPYCRLVEQSRPWILAKWAMTLDGKIASRTGHSRWISNPRSREVVHQLRGRVDAILVGRRTVEVDDPHLTARPPGPRTAARVVVDTRASLSLASRLVQTARVTPVLVAVGETADAAHCGKLAAAGCEILVCSGADAAQRLQFLLDEMGRRRWTNLLVEGGGQLLGSFFDQQWVDEVHVFIAAKVVGGASAPGPVAGHGRAVIPPRPNLCHPHIELLDEDVYIRGRLQSDLDEQVDPNAPTPRG